VTMDLSRRIGPAEAGPYDSEGFFLPDQANAFPCSAPRHRAGSPHP
jgi:hypothetical protein